MQSNIYMVHLLVCHGYASNGKTFISAKAKQLVQYLTAEMPQLQLTSPDGPQSLEGGRGQRRAWWRFAPEFPMQNRELLPDWWAQEEVEFVGASETIDGLRKQWDEGDYDGILGFSQGAAAAAVLCAALEASSSNSGGSSSGSSCSAQRLPRFVILSHGFRSPLPSNAELGWWRHLKPRSLLTPALSIAGECDSHPGPAQSEALGALFAHGSVHMVPGGAHAVPREQSDLRRIADFIATHMATRTTAPREESACGVAMRPEPAYGALHGSGKPAASRSAPTTGPRAAGEVDSVRVVATLRLLQTRAPRVSLRCRFEPS